MKNLFRILLLLASVSLLPNGALAATAPTVTTTAATGVTATSAVLNGATNPNGTATDTRFEWSTDPALSILVSTLAGSGVSGFADGTGAAAKFSAPRGVAMDTAGNIYVADTSNNRIRKITPAGVVSTFAGSTAGSTDGAATVAKFRSPNGVAVDAAGNVYVADTSNNRIRKITPIGVVSTLAGGTSGFADGTGTAARFSSPRGVAVDAAGNVYVADTTNNRIRRITPAGVVSTFAGGSTSGTTDGAAASAKFKAPRAVIVDASGTVYVADTSNNRVRKIVSGVVSTLAGGTSGFADGTGTAAKFSSPRGLALDASGNVYVADYSNNRIRKITPAAVVTTLAGSTLGFADGLASVAKFSAPSGVVIDPTGSVLHVADLTNARVRKITQPRVATAQSALVGSSVQSISASLAALSPSVTYYFRAVATSSAGSASGAILSFSTVVSADATLSALALSDGALSPAFASGVTAYTASVPYSVAAVTVTPAVTQTGATFTINGANATTIPLAVGTTTVTVLVTAQNGLATRAYTVTVTRAPASSDSTLAALALSDGALAPAFNSAVTSYSASVPNSTSSLAVTPAAAELAASVTVAVNGSAPVAVASGSPSLPLALNVGFNTITVNVTAPDGLATTAYTLSVVRASSSNVNLSALVLSGGGVLSPSFNSAVTDYSAAVPNSVASVTLAPFLADLTASLTVNGAASPSGVPITADLSVGDNAIPIVVTAQDGFTVKTYTVTITRAPSSDATLADLAPSDGALAPAFSPTTTTYTVNVPNSVSTVTLAPTPTSDTATADNLTADLAVGPNTLNLVVTAEDGTTTRTYTVTVTRAPSSDATLADLLLNGATLAPAFAPATTAYTATVPNSVTAVTLTPAVADPTATLAVNSAASPSGAAVPLNLAVGPNTVNFVVTAQDATTLRTYTVTITRAPSADATLADLILNGATLAPAFTPATAAYTASVPYATASVTVTPAVADSTATLSVNSAPLPSGATSGNLPLNPGVNVIGTLVTAQDGATTRAYTLTITRQSELDAWRLAYFGATTATGTAADTFDSDGDGAPNLLEYALGSDPISAPSRILPVVTYPAAGQTKITFPRLRAALSYIVQGSNDLVTWTPLATNPGTLGQTATYTDTSASPRRFLRLKVTNP